MTEETLFHRTLELPLEQRAAFLAEHCGADHALRQRVEALLHAHANPGDFLGPPPVPVATTAEGPPPLEGPGSRIGPYKLLQQIGEGGMGTVFMAEQQEPVRRLVALKVIKAGMDSHAVIARFEAERQALALMDHPNIARVLDAATTPSGRPYFVMELVKGVPLTKYCDEQRLTPKERLELFVPICRAVQHAHQKGIIHRDLKPSNVLVALYDGKPVPKVIDFGLAKATGQKLTEKTLVTGFGAVVGTLEYMAPEQAVVDQLDIDTRSDIYALGVLLYELLTGTTPLERQRVLEEALLEVVRRILDEEPPWPSTRLSHSADRPAIAAQRGLEPKQLRQVVQGDLDWIVMKCLEKDRNRRYETATGLAQDLERYLADEPVQARPPALTYRLRKFARRHRTGLGITAAALAALLLAGAGVVWSLSEQAAQRSARAGRAAETEKTVSVALARADELGRQAQALPLRTSRQAREALDVWRRAEDALAPAEAALRTGEADADLQQRVANLQAQLAHGRQHAERQQAQAQRREQLLHDLDQARQILATSVEGNLNYAGAAAKYAVALAAYGLDVPGGDWAALAQQIRAEEPEIREALIVALDDWACCAHQTKTSLSTADLFALADAADDDPWRREFRQALRNLDREALVRLAVAARRLALAPTSLDLLARALVGAGRRQEAVDLLRWARGRYPTDFWIALNLGHYLDSSDMTPAELEERLGCNRVAVALRPDVSASHNNLGVALHAKGQLDEAIAELRQAIALDPRNAGIHSNLGNALYDSGLHDEGIAEQRQAVALDPRSAAFQFNLATGLYRDKHLDEAIGVFRQAIALDPRAARTHASLGLALYDNGQLDEAVTAYRQAIVLDPKNAVFHCQLGWTLLEGHRVDEAIDEYRQAIALDPRYALAHNNLGNALKAKGQLDDAIAEYREATALDPRSAGFHHNLGLALQEKGQLDEAVTAYRRTIALQPSYAEAHCNLAGALAQQGHFAESLASYRRGHELGSKEPDWRYPSAEWVRQAERLVAAEEKVPALLQGDYQPRDNADRLLLIQVCHGKQLYRATARLCADAFAAEPKLADDLNAGYRYDGACYAALAAAGQGKDADQLEDAERSRLRQQALAWLRADLDLWKQRLQSGQAADRQTVRAKMQHWQRDTDLTGVREAEALKQLPAEEAKAWRQLWADVADLLQKATANK